MQSTYLKHQIHIIVSGTSRLSISPFYYYYLKSLFHLLNFMCYHYYFILSIYQVQSGIYIYVSHIQLIIIFLKTNLIINNIYNDIKI